MQIVIDIPEEEYENVKKTGGCYYDFGKAIYYGTPLPKKHGRLVDADATLKKHCVDFCKEKPSCYEDCGIYDLFHLAPTIIEADTESEINE